MPQPHPAPTSGDPSAQLTLGDVAPFTWRRMTRAAAQLGTVELGALVARGPNARWRRRIPFGAHAAIGDFVTAVDDADPTALWRPAAGGYHLGRVLLGTADDGLDGADRKGLVRRLRALGACLCADGTLAKLGLGGVVAALAVTWAGEEAHPAHGDVSVVHFDVFEHAVGVAALEADLLARRRDRS